jgi:lipopolysaccharide transport system ATP-binding protein
MARIVAENVSKRFLIPREKKTTFFESLAQRKGDTTADQVWALRDVSFDLRSGDSLGVVGRNGGGKSTLLRLIAGILRPTSGRIRVEGRMTPLLALGVGFQPDLTAEDNAILYGTIIGLRRREVKDHLDDIFDFAELHRFRRAKLKNLSAGMTMRLAFAVAAQSRNEIMLVDEVLAVGDAQFREKCLQFFDEFRAGGGTMVFVSHDWQAVEKYCNKALYLRDGAPVALGDAPTVLRQYAIADIAP